ncbi:MAG: Crp/Fnr family transcriptional regulator [Hahellaceae bacterium]|jgi:CRP-like cAMP-binding protein|nr:Crp/Fnr family transcriptional regulator [Hahellaceae bacterium]MCP5212311.1 Crp/Fnr family transcriptional regulator [Hahellaceae bacterium]
MINAMELSEIRGFAPFSQLNQSSLQELSFAIRREEVSANRAIFLQEDTNNKFYLLVSGMVTLTRLSMDGNEKVIDIVEPGQTLAETGLFLDDPKHIATAKAITDCVLYSFQCQTVKDHLQSNPLCCLQFLNTMSQKLVNKVLEIESLTMDTALSRVASYLVRTTAAQKENRTFRLPVQKQLLASRLAITPETLSRIFNKFRRDKMIEINGSDIQIPDIHAMKTKYLTAC